MRTQQASAEHETRRVMYRRAWCRSLKKNWVKRRPAKSFLRAEAREKSDLYIVIQVSPPGRGFLYSQRLVGERKGGCRENSRQGGDDVEV